MGQQIKNRKPLTAKEGITCRILLVTISVIVFLIVNVNPALAACPGGMIGSGNITSPCLITNVTQLQNMSQNLSAAYALNNDIDASETTSWNSGAGFNPVGTFTGRLDGQGYNVTGLYIRRTSTSNVGLFGSVNTANITNLSLLNVNISGINYVGGIIGSGSNTIINNTFSTGNVTASSTYIGGLIGSLSGSTSRLTNSHSTVNVSAYSYTGGLVGYLDNANISNSYASGNVSCTGYDCGGLVGNNYHGEINSSYATGIVSGTGFQFGGFIGQNYGGTIRNSYSRGNISQGSTYWNGLIAGFAYSNYDGSSSSTIINSYSTGSAVSSVNGVQAGFVSLNNGICTNSFWDTNTSGKTTSGCSATGKTTSQMKDVSTFTNIASAWDFFGDPYNDAGVNDYWNINSTYNNGYPYLTWQIDSTGIGITINTPANGSTTNNQTPQLYTTFRGKTAAYAWYNLNNTGNSTPVPNTDNLTDTLPSLPDGAHNVTVYANDSSGYLSSRRSYFTVDTIHPVVIINTPANGSTTSDSTPQLNATFDGTTVSYAWYNVNRTGNSTPVAATNNLTVNLSSLPDGTHNITVYANDSAGNLNSSISYFTVDAPPVVIINTPLNGSTTNNQTPLLNATFGGETVAYAWYNMNNTGNSTPVASTNNLIVTLSSLPDGAHNVTVYANDSGGNLNSSISYFTVDTTPPVIIINAPVNGSITNNRTPQLNATFGGVTVAYAWYRVNNTANSTPVANRNNLTVTLASLPDGAHNVTVYANDSSGNLNSSISYFTVDATRPVVTINSPANGSSTNNPTQQLNATFGGETVAYAWYRVNNTGNSTPVATTNNLTLNLSSLPDGTHNITVYANDSAGNLNSSISYFTIDLAPPVTINTPANGSITNDPTPLLNATFGGATATYAWYSVNNTGNSTPVAATNNLTLNLSSLPDGTHNVTVYANDSSGNLNSSISYFTVDTTPPVITINTPANGSITNDTTPQLNATFGGATVAYAWYSVNNTGNSTPVAATNNLTVNLSSLPDGAHNVTVYANDSAGNINSSISYFTVDTIRPVVTINTPVNDSTTNDPTQQLNATFGGETVAYAWYRVNNTGNSTPVANTNILTVSLSSLPDGSHNVTVYANDSAGNINSSIAYFTADTTLPVISINTPANGSTTNDPTPQLNATFSGETVAYAWYRVNNTGNSTPVANTNNLTANISTLPYGAHNIIVYANDSAGNLNSSISYFTVDTTPPVIAINTPANGSVMNDPTPQLNATFSGETVAYAWYRVNNTGNSTPVANTNNITVSLSSLPDGSHNVTVYANDSAGNLNSSIAYFTVDTTPPLITINTPSNSSTTSDPTPELNATFNGETVAYVWYNVNNTGNSTPAANTDNLTVALSALPDGVHNVTVYANDPAGNLNSSAVYFTVDAPPVVNINTPANGSTTSDPTPELNATFNGETVAYVWYNVNNTGNSTPAANTNNLTVNLSSLPDGAHNVTVYANDSAGNFDSSAVYFTVDTTQPSPHSGRTNSGGGGGGGGGTSGENFTNIIVKEKYYLFIQKDKVTSYRFTNDSNPILYINITGNTSLGDTATQIEVLKTTSILVTGPAPGTVYKNANIWVGSAGAAVPKNIKIAVIRFRVENSWLESNSMAGGNIRLVRWDKTRWVELETREKDKDGIYSYFEANTNSFSPFAITGLNGEGIMAPIQEQVIEKTESPAPVPTATEKKTPGYDVFLAVAALFAVFLFGRKRI